MDEEVELDEAQKLFMFTTKAEAQKKAKEIGGKVLELKRAMDGNMFAVLHKDLTKEEFEMSIEEGKTYGLTQSLLDAVKGVLNADNTNDTSDDGDEMDKVQPKALKKKFDNRKDKDIDNDGDVDDSDEYLHKRRKAVSKAIDKEEEVETDVDDDDKDDNKKAMAKVADKDDEKSDEEKQKEKEFIAKKSDRKEKIDTKPVMKEDARKRLSGMMRDKANVKNTRIPSPAERRAQMAKQQKQKKEEVELDEAKYTNKQYKMAFGVLNDPRWKGGNMTQIVNTIEKIAKGLSKDKAVADAIRITNEGLELDEAKFTDKQIKMAYGVLNDPRYKGGNLTGATKAIEKIARGLSKHPGVMRAMKATSEQVIVKEVKLSEAEMTPEQEEKREEIIMAMKKKMPEFEEKYGDRAKEVMYATATKMAMKT